MPYGITHITDTKESDVAIRILGGGMGGGGDGAGSAGSKDEGSSSLLTL